MAKPEAQIRKLFDEHSKKLVERKKKLIQSIEEWSRERIGEIKAHAIAETKSLNEEFQIQKQSLERWRQDSLDGLTKLKSTSDTEQPQSLLEQVKDLTFQLDEFKQPRQIEFLLIQTQKRLKDTSSNESPVDNNRRNESQIESTEGDDRNATRQQSSSKRISASPRQSDHQSSEPSASNSSKTGDPPDTADKNDACHKCPVCYMIFSQLMDKTNRERHVNEHYDDN